MGLPIIDIGLKLIDKLIPDPQAKQQAQFELLNLQQKGQLAELDADVKIAVAAAENVKAEAQSTSWLTSSWRPITMLTFTGLIVARFLGFTAEGISEDEYLALWSIVQVGIGGYTIGRTVEKIAPSVIAAVKK